MAEEGAGQVPVGAVRGATAAERAVRLAGMLAEAGVRELVIDTAAGPRELIARRTDLPTELLTHAPCAVRWPGGAARFSPEAAEVLPEA